MAPGKPVNKILPVLVARNPAISTRLSTRSKTALIQNLPAKEVRAKRKADCSPTKETAIKRSALGDLTNAISKRLDEKAKPGVKSNNVTKKVVKAVAVRENQAPLKTLRPKQPINNDLLAPPVPNLKLKSSRPTKSVTAASNHTTLKPKQTLQEITNANKVKTRLSNEFEKTDESLYTSAIEETSAKESLSRVKVEKDDEKPSNVTLVANQIQEKLNLDNYEVPEGVCDFDKENWNDIFQASHYAMDIFNYLKERESNLVFQDYMDRQVCLSRWMRSLLVDWMVEIQESFELNHETLYLGVKLVDLYLCRMTVGKETLQLVGAAAMFVASKYDERIPPLIDDFLYICDGAYTRRELIKMELNLLKVCDFDLGIPISYRFLRRYARCAKITMPVLTLARYILEHSLMDYATVTIRDSILACAALYLALRMKKISGWTETLEFYTGYKLEEIMSTVYVLNADLHKKPKSQLMTVRNKYNHKIFFEVAKTSLIDDDELTA